MRTSELLILIIYSITALVETQDFKPQFRRHPSVYHFQPDQHGVIHIVFLAHHPLHHHYEFAVTRNGTVFPFKRSFFHEREDIWILFYPVREEDFGAYAVSVVERNTSFAANTTFVVARRPPPTSSGIAGAVVASIVGLVLLVAAAVYVQRIRRRRKWSLDDDEESFGLGRDQTPTDDVFLPEVIRLGDMTSQSSMIVGTDEHTDVRPVNG